MLLQKLLKLSAFGFLLLLISSCEGEPGPQGQRGDNADATTIVIDVEPQDWIGNINGYSTTLYMPEINQDIFINGAVLVYCLNEENTSQQNFNMLTYTYIDGSSFEYMDFEAYIGKIEVRIKWVDNGVNTTLAPSQDYAFKVVVIQGISLSVLKSEVSVNNYEATMRFLKKR